MWSYGSSAGWRWFAVLTAALAMGLTACGGDDDDGASEGDTPQTVRVSGYPIPDLVPVQIAIDRGYFEDEGLAVELVDAPFGPDGIASLVGGTYDIGYSSISDTFAASSQGLPVRIVAGGKSQEEGKDSSALLASAAAGIESLEDLEGKRVAIDTINSLSHMVLQAALDADGLDPQGFEAVELDFPDQGAALEQGRIDAGVNIEPFVQAAVAGGAERAVPDLFARVLTEVPTAIFLATEDYLSENEEAVDSFRRALERASEDANDDPELVRSTILSFTETPAVIAQEMALPLFLPSVSTDQIQEAVDFATKWGGLTEPVDVEELVAE